jgi:predicted permease
VKPPWIRRRDIDDEIRAHLRLAIEDRVARGQSPAEAERDARLELGNDLLVRERTRDVWAGIWFERWLQDLRYALRQIRRSPGFATIAILTLALGLGAVAATFAIVNSVLLEPLHYREPQRLFSVVNLPPPRAPNRYWLINGRHFYEWRAHCRSCEDIGMAESVGFSLSSSGGSERFSGLRVSSNFFRTFDVAPALGRDFRDDEELPGRSHELILSDALWRTRFDADPRAIGRTVRVNGEPYEIVGVMPAGFRLPLGRQWGPAFGPPDQQPAMFRPLGQDFSTAGPSGNNNYVAVVRLKAGVTASEASAELNALIADFVRRFGLELKPMLLPLQDTIVRDARDGLLLLFGIAITTLLIVCVNVGNLMLVRTSSRDREIGIRAALGSSRRQLFVLILTETVVLVAIGSIAGLLFATIALSAFSTWAPRDIPRIADIHAGPRVWLMTMAAAAAAMLICGLLPAWRMASADPQRALKSGALTHTERAGRLRLRELMVGVEVALSSVLLVVGGLLAVSFLRVLSVPTGLTIEHVITQDVSTSIAGYTDAERVRFAGDAVQRLAAIPGVLAVAVTNQLPLRGESWICGLRDAGPPDRKEIATANFRFVSPGYWDATGTPIGQGRAFRESDRERPVAVVSAHAARALWPGQDPIGKHVGGCNGTVSLEVVGVADDVRAEMEKEAPVTVYQPYWTTPVSRPYFVVRTRERPDSVAADMRAALHAANPEFAVGPAATMQEIVESAVSGRRFQMNLVVAFAAFALVLASLGIYGVISFSVARRTPEIGIRLALGARASALGGLVVRQGMAPVAGGLVAGLIGAIAAGRAVSSELYGVLPDDPSILAAVAILLLLVGLCASWLPARRAMRTNPLKALRFD